MTGVKSESGRSVGTIPRGAGTSRALGAASGVVASFAGILDRLDVCWLIVNGRGELVLASSRLGTTECGRLRLREVRRHLKVWQQGGHDGVSVDGIWLEPYPIDLGVAGESFTCVVLRPDRTVEPGVAVAPLTGREKQVAEMIAAGHTARVIADRLGISYHTVRRHGEKVFRKLGVRNRVGMVRALAMAG